MTQWKYQAAGALDETVGVHSEDDAPPFARIDIDRGDGTCIEVAAIGQADGSVRVVVTGDADLVVNYLDER